MLSSCSLGGSGCEVLLTPGHPPVLLEAATYAVSLDLETVNWKDKLPSPYYPTYEGETGHSHWQGRDKRHMTVRGAQQFWNASGHGVGGQGCFRLGASSVHQEGLSGHCSLGFLLLSESPSFSIERLTVQLSPFLSWLPAHRTVRAWRSLHFDCLSSLSWWCFHEDNSFKDCGLPMNLVESVPRFLATSVHSFGDTSPTWPRQNALGQCPLFLAKVYLQTRKYLYFL